MYSRFAEQWIAQQPRIDPGPASSWRRRLACYEQLAAERGDDPQARFDAARALVRVGRIQNLPSSAVPQAARRRSSRPRNNSRPCPLASRTAAEYRQEARHVSPTSGESTSMTWTARSKPSGDSALVTGHRRDPRCPTPALDSETPVSAPRSASGPWRVSARSRRHWPEAEDVGRRCREVIEVSSRRLPRSPNIDGCSPHAESDLGVVHSGTGRLAAGRTCAFKRSVPTGRGTNGRIADRTRGPDRFGHRPASARQCVRENGAIVEGGGRGPAGPWISSMLWRGDFPEGAPRISEPSNWLSWRTC